jgi:hypothetical protein
MQGERCNGLAPDLQCDWRWPGLTGRRVTGLIWWGGGDGRRAGCE